MCAILFHGRLAVDFLSKRTAGLFEASACELGVFRAPRCVFLFFNDAESFMLERVEGDDQLSFCLGAN